MSKIASPQAAIALDEETYVISGGNLDYGLGAGVKRAWQDCNGKGQKKTIWFHASIHKILDAHAQSKVSQSRGFYFLNRPHPRNLWTNKMSSATSHLSPEAKASLPQHVAIIMDGNGRWAKQRGLPRIEGHRQGAESARAIIRAAGEVGIKYLTLYAFSAENWNRPKDEVDALMKYLVHYLKSETSELNKNNVRLEVIGQIYRLPENVQEHLRKSIHTLSKNNGLTLIMALSYGGRIEIIEAVRNIAEKARRGQLDPADINEQVISQHLWTRNFPDPDVLIRTSGEMRISNFLLWQISYAELVITPTLWPDFRKPQFYAALDEYARRHRRFGAV